MKEFKKWIKKQKYLSPNYFLGAEAAWKAALEWVLNSDPQEGTVWEMMEEELEDV